MYFLPVGNREIDCNFSRTQRLLACRDNTYFYNQDSYGLLPDDFKIEVGYEGNPFKELFMSWKQFWQQASLHPMLRFRAGR